MCDLRRIHNYKQFASNLLLTCLLDPSNEMNALVPIVYKFD